MNANTKTASFQTHGRLLQELGERLVARADVALTELIKNAYDADANQCNVLLTNDSLIVKDTGHGMSESEFLEKWMGIATPDKQLNRLSKFFQRRMTGSKGIGRFAVRFLGRELTIETIALVEPGEKQKLAATFDWPWIDDHQELRSARIPYQVNSVGQNAPTGTKLTMRRLRNPELIQISKELRTGLLSIIHPYSGLENGGFTRRGRSGDDPGFRIVLPDDDSSKEIELGREILDNAFARVTVTRRQEFTRFVITDKRGKVLLNRKIEGISKISRGFFADIRYFPRRQGMFVGTKIDGRKAWGWIRDNRNNGIGIVDHGFRVQPYGYGENDWLQLSYDAGHRRREWRSEIVDQLFGMPRGASSDSKLNPMLYLPSFHQLVGAVFVESASADGVNGSDDLTPSMDRKGFVENAAFAELRNLIRTALEMLAYVDHREQRRQEEKTRLDQTAALRKDLQSAVKFLESVPGLSENNRSSVVQHFQQLSVELDDTKEYYRVGTAKLELMGLLGVMAGFVTHEMQRILHSLEELLRKVEMIEQFDTSIRGIRETIECSLETIAGQLDYSMAFITAVHDSERNPGEYKALGAAELVLAQFRSFIQKRGIEIELQIEPDVCAPPVPKALYNGVVMNLVSNALKAVLGGELASRKRCVGIKSWNEKGTHFFEVADSGIGIPPTIQDRIWDPLFTTTSASDYNPLGSGMGLGLALVKRLVSEVNGKVLIVDPSPSFNTCFRVTYPLSAK